MKYLAYLNILFGDNHVQNSGNYKNGENGTVKFFDTLADNVFRHNYSVPEMRASFSWPEKKILGQ
jgi:hypothetical protein